MEISTKTNLVSRSIKAALFLLVPLSAGQAVFAQDSQEQLWQTAVKQFQNGNTKACYQTLTSLNELTGLVTFDRLLGLCAQGAGYNDQALLAYNRIISQQEQNAEIRLERARVLYNLNLYSESRNELLWLRAKNPPPAAQKTIQNYLSSIAIKTSRVKPNSRLKISTSLGNDNNVNSATELEDFLGFTLDDNSRASESQFYGLSLQASHQFLLAPNTGLRFSTSLSTKSYPDADFVDQDLITVGASYSKLFQNSALNIDLLAYRQSVDGDFNSRGALVRGNYFKRYSPRLANSNYITAAALRNSESLDVRDVNRYSIGTAFTLSPSSLPNDQFITDISLGHDFPVFSDSNYETDFANLKITHLHSFTNNLLSSARIEYRKIYFDNPFFALSFPEDRTDDILLARLSLDWKLNKQFNVSPNIEYRDSSSNVDLFSYNRLLTQINISYQWIW